MANGSCGVLKKHQVRPGGTMPVGSPAPRGASAQPQARIVECDGQGALIEVKCPCGRYTYIQCRWPNGAAAGGKA